MNLPRNYFWRSERSMAGIPGEVLRTAVSITALDTFRIHNRSSQPPSVSGSSIRSCCGEMRAYCCHRTSKRFRKVSRAVMLTAVQRALALYSSVRWGNRVSRQAFSYTHRALAATRQRGPTLGDAHLQFSLLGITWTVWCTRVRMFCPPVVLTSMFSSIMCAGRQFSI